MINKVADANRKGKYCPNCGCWNGSERKNCINCEAVLPKKGIELGNKIALGALIIACLSIFLGAWQVYQADRTVHTNIKPILDIGIIENKEGNRGVFLRNYGLGPAEITSVELYKNGKKLENLRSLLTYNYPYGTYDFGNHSNSSYIQKEQEITLALVSEADLKQKNFTETQINETIEFFRNRLSGTSIKIAYEDVLGEKQKPLDRTIRFLNQRGGSNKDEIYPHESFP